MIRRSLLIAMLFAFFAPAAFGNPFSEPKAAVNAILGESSEVTNIGQSPVSGYYEVEVANKFYFYLSEDYSHFFSGELMSIENKSVKNLTARYKAKVVKSKMDAFGKEGAISYKAENEVATVSVFTDISCPYCQKLHADIEDYLKLGISIDYYAFPRSGSDSASFEKYESVWCSADQKSAMEQAMSGGEIESAPSCENPVAEQFDLGNRVGVTGTPAFVLEDGRIIPGLVPAQELLKRIQM